MHTFITPLHFQSATTPERAATNHENKPGTDSLATRRKPHTRIAAHLKRICHRPKASRRNPLEEPDLFLFLCFLQTTFLLYIAVNLNKLRTFVPKKNREHDNEG